MSRRELPRAVFTDGELGAELSVQVAHDSIAVSSQYPKLPLSVVWLHDKTSVVHQRPVGFYEKMEKRTETQPTASSGGTLGLASRIRIRSNVR